MYDDGVGIVCVYVVYCVVLGVVVLVQLVICG